MNKVILVVAILVVAMLVGSGLYAQDMQSSIQKLSMDVAKAYIAPIVSGFGTNFNGGLFTKAPEAKKFGIDLEIGVVAMGTTFKDENKTLGPLTTTFTIDDQLAASLASQATVGGVPLNSAEQAALISQISGQQMSLTVSGPTVLGNKTDHVIITPSTPSVVVGSQTFVFNQQTITDITGVLDELPMLPLAAPQLKLGTVFGTQIIVRYMPSIKLNDDVGEFKYSGFGIQHNPQVWLGDMLPVDISIGYFSQSLSIGDMFEETGTAFGANVSKKLGWTFLNITPYAGFVIESSKMKINYTPSYTVGGVAQTEPITFEVEGENKSRVTLGLSVRLLVLNINADYNFGKYNSFTAGVMFAF